MSAKRVLLIVFGAIFAVLGLLVVAGGAALLYADQALQDDDGYFTSRTERYQIDSRAIVTESLDLTGVPGGTDRWGSLRLRARAPGDRPIFLGIARREDVSRYLSGVPHAVLTDVDLESFRPSYRLQAGTRAPAPPADQTFWAARAQGRGQQTLTWDVVGGNWQIVAMNPDGSAGVSVDASGGVRISHLLAIAIGVLAGGLLLLGGGITMLVFGARRPRAPPPAPAPAGGTAAAGAGAADVAPGDDPAPPQDR